MTSDSETHWAWRIYGHVLEPIMQLLRAQGTLPAEAAETLLKIMRKTSST